MNPSGVLRSLVRFGLVEHDRATDVARMVLSAFETMWKEGKCTGAVTGDADRATFEFTHSVQHGTPQRYFIERVASPPQVKLTSAFRDPAPVHVWLLLEGDTHQPLIWVHEILVKIGALDIRWFTRDEWEAHAAGAELPY